MRNIIDLRIHKGIIWNIDYVLKVYPFRMPNQEKIKYSNQYIDKFIYQGFKQFGKDFLKQVNGRFSTLYYDEQEKHLFLARDWIGEVPLHYLITSNGIYVANTILAIRNATKDKYDYQYIKAFPHSSFQVFDLSNLNQNNFENSIRSVSPQLYLNFREQVKNFQLNIPNSKLNYFKEIRNHIFDSTEKRAKTYGNNKINLLLSGGLDSLTVAVVLKRLNIEFEAYTISAGHRIGDVAQAINIAKQLKIKHHIIELTEKEISDTFEKAVEVSESYHLFNIYCAVGMLLLGKKLKEKGLAMAFSGEAVNEAVGDYTDWIVYHPIKKQEVLLQKINQDRIKKVEERIIYVWGNVNNSSKYNYQLGSGLAKHAGARMIKPFYHHQIQLENPYYDISVLGRIVSITEEDIALLGEKPGLMWEIFQEDFKILDISKKQISNTSKVRLQDNTENGENGITAILLKNGFDQEKAIEIYNKIFDANINIVKNTKRLINN
ncbi:MAG TPA: hypothetical protein EYG73_04575 [Arcobacter sp.]|nr:hypothetical protein [Arcobacter sp.]